MVVHSEKAVMSRIVSSEGPANARIALVGESPSWEELKQGQPFVGAAGRVLTKGLLRAGLPRANCYIANVVPKQPPKNKFKNHSDDDIQWGVDRLREELAALPDLELVVPLGEWPLYYTVGLHGVSQWRGSVLHPQHWPLADCNIAPAHPAVGLIRDDVAYLPTYHPAATLRRKKWTWWVFLDLIRAAGYLRDGYQGPPARTYYVEQLDELETFVSDIMQYGHLVGLDTESQPFAIMSLGTEDEVHVFRWSRRAREIVKPLLAAENVLKVAHNWSHDLLWIEERLGVEVAPPLFDTMGAAHLLDPEMEKSLSPHLSTRYTQWPYHEWLSDVNPMMYNAMDTAVCIDAYWPLVEELFQEQPAGVDGVPLPGGPLAELAGHDMQLQYELLEMSRRGLPVDAVQQAELQRRYSRNLSRAEKAYRSMAEDKVREALAGYVEALREGVAEKDARRRTRFKKPHLFFTMKQCPCCGGGAKKAERCWSCAGFDRSPTKTMLVEAGGDGELLKAELEEQMLGPCVACDGNGRFEHWLPINVGSDHQRKDILYRTRGAAKARRYKGNETVKRNRLEGMQNKTRLVEVDIRVSELRSDYETIERLAPDHRTGCIHAIFDQFTTRSGRTASKEGLVLAGTNVQNIPVKARRIIVAPDGCVMGAADMAQIEARNVALLGQDPKLLDIYRTGGDSHTRVMELIREHTGFDMNDVKVGTTKGKGRDVTKRSVYATMYGVGAGHLAGELGVDLPTAEQIRQVILRTFPGIQRYQDSAAETVRESRYVQAHVERWRGHRRVFRSWIYDRKTRDVKEKVLKEAWSHPPQDMAAYVLAKGLLELRHTAPWIDPRAHVHDEIVALWPLERLVEGMEQLLRALSRELWGMYFPAELGIGRNWYTAKKESDEFLLVDGQVQRVLDSGGTEVVDEAELLQTLKED